MKILHAGDIHFKGDLLEEITKCTNHLIKTAKEASPDVVVLAGDLFDERQTYDSQTFLAAMDFVRRLSGHAPVLIVKGTPSHDGHTLEFLRSERVYVSEKPEQVPLTEDGLLESYDIGPLSRAKAVFSCLPSISKAGVLSVMEGDLNGSNFNTVELMRDVLAGWGETNATIRASGVSAVLVGHLSVMGATLSTGQQMVGREVELGVGDLRMAKAELVCLGHIHNAQNWSEVFYCGSLTRLNFGEEEEKGFWMHTIENGILTSKFIKTPARIMVTVDLDVPPAAGDIPDVPEGAFVRVRYEVSEEAVHNVDETTLRKALTSSGAAGVRIEKVVVPKQRVRAEGISKVLSLEKKLKKWAEVCGLDVPAGAFSKLSLLEREEKWEKENETDIA